MGFRLRLHGALAATILVVAGPGCATTGEPPNLDPHKRQIRAYMESGDYLRAVERVASDARQWIETRVAQGGTRPTVVFDLDETLFFNWPHLRAVDFGYVEEAWDRWVEEAKAPPIEPVKAAYQTARRLGVDVVFVTGRPEKQRASTARNLREIGCGDYAELVCKGADDPATNGAFKTQARRRLVAAGRTIIANLGDQESDLSGGYAERVFKLPNVVYLAD